MIAIIDYKAGNLASVSNAFSRLGTDHMITDEINRLEQADGVVFPGVGHARSAMEALHETGIDRWLQQTKKPVLGICLGMQLFYEKTVEGPCETLGIIPGHLRKFDNTSEKVPHMGWNTLEEITYNHPILDGIDEQSYFYFVHSYYAPVNDYTVASCLYGVPFTAVTARDNFAGVQFHPEKSGIAGERLLRNFIEWVSEPESHLEV